MTCRRCSFPMAENIKEYHHICWMCGNIEHSNPSYHIPTRSVCLGCGKEIEHAEKENSRARCDACRKKHCESMRERRAERAMDAEK